jgi:hypothetical protein
VDLRVEGQNSLSVPPAHRLHVSLSSEDSEVFESASTDVLDLVETVCDMIGEELQMGEELPAVACVVIVSRAVDCLRPGVRVAHVIAGGTGRSDFEDPYREVL